MYHHLCDNAPSTFSPLSLSLYRTRWMRPTRCIRDLALRTTIVINVRQIATWDKGPRTDVHATLVLGRVAIFLVCITKHSHTRRASLSFSLAFFEISTAIIAKTPSTNLGKISSSLSIDQPRAIEISQVGQCLIPVVTRCIGLRYECV